MLGKIMRIKGGNTMCELCNLEKKTEWYYEDDYFIVCDCETCKVPMIVSKRHTLILNQEEIIDLMFLLPKFLPDWKNKTLDQRRRKVPDHWHCHIR